LQGICRKLGESLKDVLKKIWKKVMKTAREGVLKELEGSFEDNLIPKLVIKVLIP
jgi:hypothetical protein